MQLIGSLTCKFQASWLATDNVIDSQLVGLQCHRLTTFIFWVHNSQLVNSLLSTHWLTTSSWLACSLEILLTLLCGVCSTELLQNFITSCKINDSEFYQSRVDFPVVNADQKLRHSPDLSARFSEQPKLEKSKCYKPLCDTTILLLQIINFDQVSIQHY